MCTIGNKDFDNPYRPGVAGAHYQYLTDSVESKVFHEGADITQWKSPFARYTAHQQAVVCQNVTNSGAGKTITAPLPKSADMLYNTYLASSWFGLKANCECGVKTTSYVNGRAIMSSKVSRIKIANSTLFEIDPAAQMAVIELTGQLDDYASMIGFYYTREQLIEDSKYDSILYAPWTAFYPGQGHPELTYAFGMIAFHPCTYESQVRPISELVVNYDGVQTRGRGMMALPSEISTGAIVSSSTVDFMLVTTQVWLSKEERTALLNGYNETIFKEYILIGEHTESASCVEKKITFDLNCKGPVAYMFMTIQSIADINAGNWVKKFDDFGLDYIHHFMVITGNTAREDGLSASFYRSAKAKEMFDSVPSTGIYVIGFQTKDSCMSGHQSMTNVEKLQMQATAKSHACGLVFKVYAAVYNGCYTERGAGGAIWAR